MNAPALADVIRLDDFRASKIELPAECRKRKRSPKPIAARLAAKVDTSGGFFACHPWTGSVMQANGYGQIHAVNEDGKRTMRTAHSVAWEVHNKRPVPKGKIILHAKGCCKTCCNGLHLRAGTHGENAQDRIEEHPHTKHLTKAEVRKIVALHERQGLSAAELARRFKRDPSTTRRILRGESWSKVTGIERHRKTGGKRPRASRHTMTVGAVEMAIAS